MTQMTLLVAVAIDNVLKENCAFCNEEKGVKEKLVLEENWRTDTNEPDIADDGNFLQAVNDSGKLAGSLGGKPKWTIELESTEAGTLPYIKDDYFKYRSDVSAGIQPGAKGKYFLRCNVCPNAHHLIPGNDSMAKSVDINKWLADKIEWKSVSYESDQEKIDELPGQILEEINKNGSHVQTTNKTDYVETKVRTYTDSGNVKTIKTKHYSGRVTGKLEYNINNMNNGIWLPGNNAVIGWKYTDDEKFKKQYVKNAIKEAGDRQFHDAHKAYSKRVKEELDELGKKIGDMETKCLMDDSHESSSKPLPAPTKLVKVLDEFSRLLEEKLTSPKSKWAEPFITSTKSLWAK